MSWPSLDRHKAELVARRDLRDATNEIRLILAMVTLTLAIPIASAVGIRALAYFGGGTAVVNRLAVVGAFFVVFIPASFSLVLALEAFVGERERTTLEVLLSTPLKEAEIYAGKVAAVLVVSLGLCYGGLIVYCFAVFPGLGFFPFGVLVALALSTICQVAAMVAGAVIISLNARTMRAANVMASFIILPMSVVLQVEAALILLGRAELLWGFAALMIVIAAVLLRMGLAGFSREALLAREVGLSKPLRRAIGSLRAAFQGRPGIIRLIWMRRLPTALACVRHKEVADPPQPAVVVDHGQRVVIRPHAQRSRRVVVGGVKLTEMSSKGLLVAHGVGVRQEKIALHALAKDLHHFERGLRHADHPIQVSLLREVAMVDVRLRTWVA